MYNINSEVQMLDHMEKIRGGLIVQKPIVRPKVGTLSRPKVYSNMVMADLLE